MNFFLIHLAEAAIYPPGGPILLLAAGLLLIHRKRRMAFALIGLALGVLYFSSIPAVNGLLSRWLETDPPPALSAVETAGAVVVLGFGPYYGAPEYGGETSGRDEFSRLRYAAWLHNKTRLPIAVVGGDRLKTGITGAKRMSDVLKNEFNIPVRYQDGRSLHTFDNARYAHQILSKDGIDRIVLVTHSWHMPRSKLAFEAAGFSVIPAPTQYFVPGPLQKGVGAWFPTAEAMERNNWYFHEIIGRLYFRLFK